MEEITLDEVAGNDTENRIEDYLETPPPTLRRSSRTPKPNMSYSPSLHYLLLTDSGEPESYKEAKIVGDSLK